MGRECRNGYLGEEIGRGGNEERCGSRKKEKWIQEPGRTAATGGWRVKGERGSDPPLPSRLGRADIRPVLQQGGGQGLGLGL